MFSKKILSIVGLLFVSSKVFATPESCGMYISENGCAGASAECIEGDEGYYLDDSQDLFVVSNSGSGIQCGPVTGNGYYILKNNKPVLIKVSGEIGEVDDNTDATCGNGGDGGNFHETSVFCLEQGKPLDLSSGGSYMFTDVDGVFTDNTGEVKKVIVKVTSDAIVLDSELMEKTYNYCVDVNLKVWNRKEDLCTNSSDSCTYYQCANGECGVADANLPPKYERAQVNCNLGEPDANCENNGYYLYRSYDTTKAVLKNDDEFTGATTLVQCTNSPSWSCNEVTGAAIPIGYVRNAGAADEFIKCVSDGPCTAETSIEPGLVELSEGTYMIDIGTSGLLGIADESSKFVNVIRTANSVLVDRESVGYYTVNGNNIQETRAYPVVNGTPANLYYCTANGGISKCEEVAKPIGYLINKGDGSSGKPFIKCIAGGSCVAVAPESSCDGNHGELYVDGESTKICGVTDRTDITKSDLILAGADAISGEKYYIASVASENDQLFGIKNKTGYYIVLKFKDENVTVETDPSARYRYTRRDSNLIVGRSDAIEDSGDQGICKVDNGVYPNAFEYILANWDGATTGLSDVSYYVNEEYNA